LVEQLIRNQQVNGSSPFVGSIQASQKRSAGWPRPPSQISDMKLLLLGELDLGRPEQAGKGLTSSSDASLQLSFYRGKRGL
jgi:hypothetical protein